MGDIVNGELVYGLIKYNTTTIEGEFVGGLPNKQCLFKGNNIVYDGQWENGIINGFGFYKDNNITYEGEWKNNSYWWREINEINGIYDGCFIEGKKMEKVY